MKDKKYPEKIINEMKKIDDGINTIFNALKFSSDPKMLAEACFKENKMVDVDFLKFVIKNKIQSDFFNEAFKKVIFTYKEKNLFLGKFSNLINSKKNQYNQKNILNPNISTLSLANYEMMVTFCFEYNNIDALKNILSIVDIKFFSLFHKFCSKIEDIQADNIEIFYNLIQSTGREVIDKPENERELCFYSISPYDAITSKGIENFLLFINLLPDNYFKNETFLEECISIGEHVFGEADEILLSEKQIENVKNFQSIVDKKRLSHISNVQINKKIIL